MTTPRIDPAVRLYRREKARRTQRTAREIEAVRAEYEAALADSRDRARAPKWGGRQKNRSRWLQKQGAPQVDSPSTEVTE